MLDKGDLVYLPSSIMMFQFAHSFDKEKEGAIVNHYKTLLKPTNVLIVEHEKLNDQYYKILHDGQHWYVKENDIMRLNSDG